MNLKSFLSDYKKLIKIFSIVLGVVLFSFLFLLGSGYSLRYNTDIYILLILSFVFILPVIAFYLSKKIRLMKKSNLKDKNLFFYKLWNRLTIICSIIMFSILLSVPLLTLSPGFGRLKNPFVWSIIVGFDIGLTIFFSLLTIGIVLHISCLIYRKIKK
jgi:hypothetical protein